MEEARFQVAIRLPLQKKQGLSIAQFNLVMHFHGQGVPVDYVEAMRWLELSAERGNELANHAKKAGVRS